MKKVIDYITVALTAAMCVGGMCVFFASEPQKYSQSERRRLADMPYLSIDTLADGSYFDDTEIYITEHFPLRDLWRRVKAYTDKYVLGRRDCGGVINEGGYLSCIDTNGCTDDVKRAADIIKYVRKKYLGSARCAFAVIPDKTYFLRDYGYPDTNCEIIDAMKKELSDFEYADIVTLLSLDDYYRTDTHWSQDKITDIAEYIGNFFGADVSADYKTHYRENFYGVLAPRYSLPVLPDTLYYLTNEATDGCTVYDYETGDTLPVYNTDAADMYDTFLHGTRAILRIDNPASDTGRGLIIFRDSFASSLAPLLVGGYDSITLVDLRYVGVDDLGHFIDFSGQDVLFLYSTIVIRQSETLVR